MAAAPALMSTAAAAIRTGLLRAGLLRARLLRAVSLDIALAIDLPVSGGPGLPVPVQV